MSGKVGMVRRHILVVWQQWGRDKTHGLILHPGSDSSTEGSPTPRGALASDRPRTAGGGEARRAGHEAVRLSAAG